VTHFRSLGQNEKYRFRKRPLLKYTKNRFFSAYLEVSNAQDNWQLYLRGNFLQKIQKSQFFRKKDIDIEYNDVCSIREDWNFVHRWRCAELRLDLTKLDLGI